MDLSVRRGLPVAEIADLDVGTGPADRMDAAQMTLLSRYVLRCIATPFAVSLGVVLLALVLERMLEIMQAVTSVGAPAWRALELVVYLLPHYLALAVPAALFLGVLLGVRRLHLDSELTVVHVAGIPFTRLLRPVVGLALLLGILVAINAAVVQPHARYAHRATLHDLVTRPVQFDLEAGVFHAFGNGTVLRADRIAKGGSVLQGVFAARRTDAGERVMVVAAEGRIALGQDGRILVMRLFNGDLIRTGGSESAERVGFDNYVWRVPLGSRAPYGERGQDERELTLTELAAGDRDRLPQSVTSDQVAAELSARLIEPASLPLLALLAAPFAVLGGGGRTARATNLVLAVGVLILYQKLLGFAEALAAQGSVAPLLSQWAVLVGFAVLTAALIRVVTNGLSRRRRAFAPAKAGADAETA